MKKRGYGNEKGEIQLLKYKLYLRVVKVKGKDEIDIDAKRRRRGKKNQKS